MIGTSAYSTNTSSYGLSSATNSYYMSPQRGSTLSNNSGYGPTSHASADYSIPSATGPLGSPGFSSSQHNSLLPSLNQSHDPNRQSTGSDFPPQESRRSSVGSQVNQGMGSLQINGASSPYSTSVNHSQTSLAQNLQRERGIAGFSDRLRNSRSTAQLHHGHSPMSPETHEGRPSTAHSRVAPPIGRNPRSDIYNAHEPIPGQAYAFPDAPDMEPGALPPKSASRQMSNASNERPSFSRRDSGQASIASSVLTTDSHLPPGQHRLDDAHMPGTHHHTLQQNQMSNLNDDDEAMTPEEGSQPYSRTPALRVSHKMAERKRRSEMKDLFENLRSQIPSNQGSKSSKWEILTKASEYISQLEKSAVQTHGVDKQLRLACHDIDITRQNNEKLRSENERLAAELAMLKAQAGGQAPQAPPPPPPQQAPPQHHAPPLYPQHYVPPPPPPAPGMHDPSRSLPPLSSATSAPSSMQGVQYSSEHR